MTKLHPAMLELLCDPDGKRAEECLFALIADLERAGLKQHAIAKAQSRVLLAFCAENGRKLEKFGWANSVLWSTSKVLEAEAWKHRKRWVRRFMKRTGRLYQDASISIDVDVPIVRDAMDARLSSIDPQGQA